MKYIHPKRLYREFYDGIYSLFWYYLVPDVLYLKHKYRKVFGCKLDLRNPRKFSEKIQWLKLYDRNPLYHKLVDKVAVKDWVKNKIGEQYVIPTYAVWSTIEDVDISLLPEQFVIKCSHDAASWSICHDRESFDEKSALDKIRRAIKQDYYHYDNKQWAYKDVPRRIIAEQFIKDSSEIEIGLTDYKFFCFDGKADCVMIAKDREKRNPIYYFFDREWHLLRYNYRGENAPEDFTLPKPDALDTMFLVAETLSKGFSFVRVDLYNSDGKILFGEMTFYPDGGMDPYILPEVDLLFGEKLKLPAKRK
jgi:hypothetical protein